MIGDMSQLLSNQFRGFDAADAKCYRPEDRQKILDVIVAGFGDIKEFNREVRNLLSDAWLSGSHAQVKETEARILQAKQAGAIHQLRSARSQHRLKHQVKEAGAAHNFLMARSERQTDEASANLARVWAVARQKDQLRSWRRRSRCSKVQDAYQAPGSQRDTEPPATPPPVPMPGPSSAPVPGALRAGQEARDSLPASPMNPTSHPSHLSPPDSLPSHLSPPDSLPPLPGPPLPSLAHPLSWVRDVPLPPVAFDSPSPSSTPATTPNPARFRLLESPPKKSAHTCSGKNE